MVSPRALQLAQNNYDISNASSAKPSPKLPQTRTLYRTTSCNHGRYRYEREDRTYRKRCTLEIVRACTEQVLSSLRSRQGLSHGMRKHATIGHDVLHAAAVCALGAVALHIHAQSFLASDLA